MLDRRVEKLNCTLSASASKVIHIEERKLLESSLSSRCTVRTYVGVRVKAYVEINFHASRRLEFISTIFARCRRIVCSHLGKGILLHVEEYTLVNRDANSFHHCRSL